MWTLGVKMPCSLFLFAAFASTLALELPPQRASPQASTMSSELAQQCESPEAMLQTDERFIIAWPCDPGECHIYFGQQRKALTTNFNLARATNRTLVLAPFTWYEGQAQQYTNTFKRTAAGVRPLFTRFSELFDLSSFERPLSDGTRIRVIELCDFAAHEVAAGRRLEIDLAIMSKGIPRNHERDLRSDPELDKRLVVPYNCSKPLEGIALNMSEAGSGELWGFSREHVAVHELRCGYAMLAKAWAASGKQLADFGTRLESPELFGGKRLVALLGTGHQLHSHATDAAAADLNERLAYAPHLVAQAEAFVRESLAPLVQAARAAHGLRELHAQSEGAGYVSVHWRHGDYVPYGHVTEPEMLERKVAQARDKLPGACATCPVFLATNCRDRHSIEQLRRLIAPMPLLAYEPPDGPEGDPFRSEGTRLAVEMLVAARASIFVRSSRSAVSAFIDVERRRLGLGAPELSVS